MTLFFPEAVAAAGDWYAYPSRLSNLQPVLYASSFPSLPPPPLPLSSFPSSREREGQWWCFSLTYAHQQFRILRSPHSRRPTALRVIYLSLLHDVMVLPGAIGFATNFTFDRVAEVCSSR